MPIWQYLKRLKSTGKFVRDFGTHQEEISLPGSGKCIHVDHYCWLLPVAIIKVSSELVFKFSKICSKTGLLTMLSLGYFITKIIDMAEIKHWEAVLV